MRTILALFTLALGMNLSASPVTLPAQDPRIQFAGQADFSDTAVVRYDWSLSGPRFMVAPKTAWVEFLLDDGSSDFDVVVDGKPGPVIRTQAGVQAYRVELGDSASAKARLVELVKRTEATMGGGAFLGLRLEDGAQLLKAPAAREPRILVLGDSWTAGYGVEASNTVCASVKPWENARLAFPSLVAQAFGGEARVLAVSGKGVTRFYGSPKAFEADNYGAYFGRMLGNRAGDDRKDDGWRPDAVIVHLGLNDFSTQPEPSDAEWAKAYVDLLQRLRQRHPGVPVFCCLTEGWPNKMAAMYTMAGEAEKRGLTGVTVVALPSVSAADMGCDYHPNATAHIRLAKPIIEAIERELGWGRVR